MSSFAALLTTFTALAPLAQTPPPAGARVQDGLAQHQQNTDLNGGDGLPDHDSIPTETYNGQPILEARATAHALPATALNDALALSRRWNLSGTASASDSDQYASLYTMTEPTDVVCVLYTSMSGRGDLYGSDSRLESTIGGQVQVSPGGITNGSGTLSGEQMQSETPTASVGLGLGIGPLSLGFPFATWDISSTASGPDGHLPVAHPEPGSNSAPTTGGPAGSPSNFRMPVQLSLAQGSAIVTQVNASMNTNVQCTVHARGADLHNPMSGGQAAFTKATIDQRLDQGYFLFATPTVPTILVFSTLCTVSGRLVGPPGLQVKEHDGGLLLGPSGSALVPGGPGVILITRGPLGDLQVSGDVGQWDAILFVDAGASSGGPTSEEEKQADAEAEPAGN